MEVETGYIYCISNLDIMPNIYKVGVTLRSPLERLKEANSSDTWKIPSYKIEFAKKVTNPKEKEKTLHLLMEKFMTRIHPRREFFRGDINDIKEAFKLMDGDIWDETPPEPIVSDRPTNLENSLSEDTDNHSNGPYPVGDSSNSQVSDYNGGSNPMRELEICKSSEHKREGINYWVLYNKKNHRCNNRRATYNELKYALDNWNTTEVIEPECKIYFYPKGEYKSLLEKGLLLTESKEEKEAICVLGQDWDNEYLTTGECCWNKIIFYDFREEQYYLRSFAKGRKRGDGKELKESRINGWYIDLSTMGAPREFWDYLKDKLSYQSQPLPNNIKKILWSDEVGEITDKFNNTYSFGDYWKNNYIKKIHKNGRLFKCDGGVHRGYSIWLDNEDIVHISHGHKNKDIISHYIFNDNSLTSGWMCNWGNQLNCKLTKEEIQTIHNHFGI